MPHISKPYLKVFFLKLLGSSKNYIFILNQTFLIALRKNCWITSHSPVYPLWLAWTNHTGPRPSRGHIEPMSAGHALCSWTALVGFWEVESCLCILFVKVLHRKVVGASAVYRNLYSNDEKKGISLGPVGCSSSQL